MATEVWVLPVGSGNFSQLTPLLDGQHQVSAALLLHDTDHRSEAEILGKELSSRGLPVSRLELPSLIDAEPLQARLLHALTELHADYAVLNASAGDRLLALKLTRLFVEMEWPVCCVDSTRDVLVWISSNRAEQTIADRAKLKNYFASHGFDLVKQGMDMPITPALRRLAEQWVLELGRDPKALRTLNRLAFQADGSLMVTLPHNDTAALRLADDLMTSGLTKQIETDDGQGLQFVSEAARFFANGGWLECFVYSELQKLRSNNPKIQDLAMGVEIHALDGSGVRNELDVVALIDNRLHLIECKTSWLKTPADAGNTVYKLDSIADMLGGDPVKALLVSFHPFNPGQEKRANRLDIEILDGQELFQVRSFLQSWTSH